MGELLFPSPHVPTCTWRRATSMCQEGRGQIDRHLGSSTSSHGEGAMLSSAQTAHGAALVPGSLLPTADRKRWLPSATTGCGDILPLSQAGFRQVSVQHLRICPGDKQQHYWRGAGHVSGEEDSGTSLTTEPQQPHTQANGSETRQ